MTRAEGERHRAREIVARLRASLVAIEDDIADQHPAGLNAPDAILATAARLLSTMARLDAYLRAEMDVAVARQRTMTIEVTTTDSPSSP